MVNTTPGGKYLNVATGTIDLGSVYTRLIATAEKKQLESDTINHDYGMKKNFKYFWLSLLSFSASNCW